MIGAGVVAAGQAACSILSSHSWTRRLGYRSIFAVNLMGFGASPEADMRLKVRLSVPTISATSSGV